MKCASTAVLCCFFTLFLSLSISVVIHSCFDCSIQ